VWVRLPPLVRWNNGGLAQLARAFALHAKGRGFDSLILHFVMIRKRMTEQTLSMKWKLMKHNKSVDKTQTVQPLQNLYAGVAE
jgi:hypothetical protein